MHLYLLGKRIKRGRDAGYGSYGAVVERRFVADRDARRIVGAHIRKHFKSAVVGDREHRSARLREVAQLERERIDCAGDGRADDGVLKSSFGGGQRALCLSQRRLRSRDGPAALCGALRARLERLERR